MLCLPYLLTHLLRTVNAGLPFTLRYKQWCGKIYLHINVRYYNATMRIKIIQQGLPFSFICIYIHVCSYKLYTLRSPTNQIVSVNSSFINIVKKTQSEILKLCCPLSKIPNASLFCHNSSFCSNRALELIVISWLI